MKWMRSSCKKAFELLLRTAAHVSKPRFKASSTIKEPMKPLAPVMSIFGFMRAKVQRRKRKTKVIFAFFNKKHYLCHIKT